MPDSLVQIWDTCFFFFQAEDGIRDSSVTGVQTCALPIYWSMADVSKVREADALIKSAIDQFGKIDILINNAGLTRDNLIMMMKEEDWDVVIDTNLKSAWNCSKAAVRAMMRKRYGRIVNITSVSGIAGQRGRTNYSASKAGLIGLTKALAREVPPRQITRN